MNDIERTYDRVLIKIKLIGLYQIIGGIIGIGIFIRLASATENVNLELLLLYVLVISLYSYSILCGIQLFRNPVSGLRLTLINQIIQIFQIAFLGYAYKYLSGFGVMFGFNLTDDFISSFNLELSSFLMYFNTEHETRFIKLNILAILLSYYTIVLQERYEGVMKEKEIKDIEEIGA